MIVLLAYVKYRIELKSVSFERDIVEGDLLEYFKTNCDSQAALFSIPIYVRTVICCGLTVTKETTKS